MSGDYLPTGYTWYGNKKSYLIVGRDERKRPALAGQANGHKAGEVHETKRPRNRDSKKRRNEAGMIHPGVKAEYRLNCLATYLRYLGTHDMMAPARQLLVAERNIEAGKTAGAGIERQRGQAAV